MMKIPRTLALLGLALVAAPLEQASTQEAMAPRFTVEAYGGASTFGRFLEQRIGGAGERELTANTALAVGGSVGLRAWDRASVRLGFTWSPTELEFEDDRDLGVGDFDEEALTDLDAYVLSLEVLSLVLGEERRLSPYAVAGIAGGWWSLDGEDEAEFGAGEDHATLATEDGDTQFRPGGVLGTGLQLRATPRLLIRLEAATFRLGNPFDGDESFRVASGQTFDEPERVGMNRFTLNLAYAFGGR
jgi:opacity protein-like surface antigen